MKHTSQVTHFEGSHQQLAEEIGNLYYDSLAELFKRLGEKLKRDADADYGRGRPKLSKELAEAADHMYLASENISAAWQICKPHIKN